jgi:uncharacterized integral membrane protein (TIGR00697 family)
MKPYRYFDLIMAAFVAVLLISNIASNKIVNLGELPAFGPLIFDGGTILFPLSYIFGDVLTEVYGYSRSRRVIWTGFALTALMAVVLWVVTQLPSAAGTEAQGAAFNQALAITPFIVLGSLVAFFAGEFSNSFILAKMKVATRGRWLWMRTIGSTLVGEGVDTLLFATIAFAVGGALTGNPMDGGIFATLVWSNYLFKVGIEVLFTPITYAVVGFLKRAEREDYYDVGTDFNPFVLTQPLERRPLNQEQ